MSELLLELLCDEIPARMQSRAATDLRDLMSKALAVHSISVQPDVFVTPRRLTLHAIGLPLRTADTQEVRRGPRIDAPEKAIEGFLKSTGLVRDQLTERADGKATFLYAVIDKPGRATIDVIAEIIPAMIRDFAWPKSMRWGAASASMASLRWVRPLQSILCLFDGRAVPFEVAGITSSTITRGHRFLGSQSISVRDFAEYRQHLHDNFVMLDSNERARHIEHLAQDLAQRAGLTLIDDPALLAENAGLTEWPVPLLGQFDPAFLAVPAEVIQLTMRTNQKYFVLRDAQGKLSNHFICVANIVPEDGGAAILAGNQKVLTARLSDAKFFWEQDCKKQLADFAPKLADIVFHEQLGSMAEKVERVAALAQNLAPVCGTDPALAERAARLCKADLTTSMVGEFPELQGIMGGYYAALHGEDAAVVTAIRDHYKPVGQSDDVPTAPVTVAVALADKLDTLAVFFEYPTLRPTGSSDPFALRRAALGLLRLVTQNNIRLNILPSTFSTRWQRIWQRQRSHGGSYLSAPKNRLGFKPIYEEEDYALYDFLIERLKVQQREVGVRNDLIDAVFARGGEDDFVRVLALVNALQAFLETDDGTNLLAGYKRAANILAIEEKKDARTFGGAINDTLLHEPEEQALYQSLRAMGTSAEAALKAENFTEAMTALATLRAPIDAFFDKLLVNSDARDLRINRLELLAGFRSAVNMIADFAKIEG